MGHGALDVCFARLVSGARAPDGICYVCAAALGCLLEAQEAGFRRHLGKKKQQHVKMVPRHGKNVIGLLQQVGADRLAADVRDIDTLFSQHLDSVGAGRLAMARTEAGRGNFDPVAGHVTQKALGHRAAADISRADEKDVLHEPRRPIPGPSASVTEAAGKSIRPPDLPRCLCGDRMAAMKKLSALLAAVVLPVISLVHASEPAPTGPFTLPELPYAYDALEPHIDTETMKIHHNKHHAAYVNNANKALAGHPDLSKLTVWELVAHLDEVPEEIRTTLRNNAGGHANHSLFWLMMKPGGGGEPTGDLAEAIKDTFGSFAGFKEEFTAAAMRVFGSGWAWLTITPDGEMVIETSPNQDSPLMNGGKPLLGLDVWEHAYYLKNQNRRGEYIDAWWDVVNWEYVAGKYNEAKR